MELSQVGSCRQQLSFSARLAVHAGFVLIGAVNTIVGPILPALSAKWSLTDAQAGTVFVALFLGTMLGALMSGTLAARRGFLAAICAGYGLMCAGICGLGAGSWAIGLLSLFGCGIGLGLAIPATNMMIAEVNPHRRAAALNLLNVAWVGGAILWPLLTGVALESDHLSNLLALLAAGLGLVFLLLLRPNLIRVDRPLQPEADPGRSSRRLWRSQTAVIVGFLFFLYVGTETALGGWAAAYAKRIAWNSQAAWVSTPSFFWGGLLVGRALAPAILRRITEGALTIGGLFVTALGIAWLHEASQQAGVMASIGLAGLGMAAVFPITIALLPDAFGGDATRMAGPMFLLGGLGGAIFPWLVGVLSAYFGSLKVGLAIPSIGCLAMIVLHLMNRHYPMRIASR